MCFPEYLCASNIGSACGDRKRALAPLGMEFQVVGRHRVSAGWEMKQFSGRLIIESSLQLHMVANFTGLLIIYLDTFTLAYVFKNKLVEKKGDQIALGLEIPRWHRGAGEGRSSQFSCIQSSFT